MIISSESLCFNSIKVRLRLDLDHSVNPYGGAGFNSIKVRLRLVDQINALFGFTFQFHKGAIKTALEAGRLSRYEAFQFHKGAIKTSFRFFISKKKLVSIP